MSYGPWGLRGMVQLLLDLLHTQTAKQIGPTQQQIGFDQATTTENQKRNIKWTIDQFENMYLNVNYGEACVHCDDIKPRHMSGILSNTVYINRSSICCWLFCKHNFLLHSGHSGAVVVIIIFLVSFSVSFILGRLLNCRFINLKASEQKNKWSAWRQAKYSGYTFILVIFANFFWNE